MTFGAIYLASCNARAMGPMKQPTVSARLVEGLLSFAADNGAPRDALLADADIPSEAFEDPDGRVPIGDYQALMARAKAATGDPALALRWGEAVDMADVSIVGLIMNASRTMGEAFEQLQRFNRLALEVDTVGAAPRFVLQPERGALWMIDTRVEPNAFPEISEVSFARLVCGPRRFLDKPHVLEVRFTHPEPSYRQEYDRIFQCPVHFSQSGNAMRLAPDIASWPVALQPAYVLPIISRHAEALLERIAEEPTVRAAVESRLVKDLPKGDFTAASVAADLGLSRQSLYRKLRAEGASFSQVVDDLRKEMAIDLLRDRRTSVAEAAYLLGFSDPASLSRAFKRWTGRSPRDVRRRSSGSGPKSG